MERIYCLDWHGRFMIILLSNEKSGRRNCVWNPIGHVKACICFVHSVMWLPAWLLSHEGTFFANANHINMQAITMPAVCRLSLAPEEICIAVCRHCASAHFLLMSFFPQTFRLRYVSYLHDPGSCSHVPVLWNYAELWCVIFQNMSFADLSLLGPWENINNPIR